MVDRKLHVYRRIEKAGTRSERNNCTGGKRNVYVALMTHQVAAGVLGAILWMIENPNEGVCLPDDLPHEFILDIAKPYLGEWISSPYNWDPLSKRRNLFENQKIAADTWQFNSFLY